MQTLEMELREAKLTGTLIRLPSCLQIATSVSLVLNGAPSAQTPQHHRSGNFSVLLHKFVGGLVRKGQFAIHTAMRFIICLCSLVIFGNPVIAAQFLKIDKMSSTDLTAILLYGEIQAGDLNELLSVQTVSNTPKTVLFLESPGGDAREGLTIAKFVHNQNWGTAVVNKGQCYSACATIWIAGGIKFLSDDAILGFHDVYSAEGPSAPGNAIVGAFYGQPGLSDRVIQYLTSAPPDKFNYLNLSLASEIGLEVVDYDKLMNAPADTSPLPVQNSDTSANPAIVERPLDVPTQSPATVLPTDQSAFTAFDQIDIVGHDIVEAATKSFSADSCRQICQGRSDCSAYTFDSKHQMCFPKNGGRLKLYNSQAASGARQDLLSQLRMSNISLQSKSRIVGNEYKTIKHATIGDCVEQCDLDKTCKAFTYASALNSCWMFDTISVSTPSRGWMVGIKN